MQDETRKELIRNYFKAMGEMNIQAWLEFFDKDALVYDPVGEAPMQGHAGLQKFFEPIKILFKNMNILPNQIYVNGTGAAVKWTGNGMLKNDTNVTFEGIDVFEFNESGKISTLWAYGEKDKKS